ncbi:MAG: 2,3-bisphosphoglycerate-independent phosphoglycerate mutase [Eubacteriales bacterium]|nr:2,3-bisphosphoglycerate-independent phosphoglycerate mutase [Eubacteriales bacterium]
MKKQNVLCILDGYGLSNDKNGNAIYLANTPIMDKLEKEYPFVRGNASENFVGLPKGQMGNSEVGHLNIGAGRVVYQELTRITKAIEDGDFFKNKDLLNAIYNVKKYNSSLNILGLLSDGGVHSHNSHLYALLDLAKRENISKVYIHIILDGRDTPPNSGIKYIKELQEKIKEIGIGQISSICGRYYAMDRDNNYDRIKLAYDMLTNNNFTQNNNENVYKDPISAIEESYKNNIYDEFVKPCIISSSKHTIENNDSIIFFNFRPDRAREITRAFCDNEFKQFERKKINTYFVCFTNYDETINEKCVAFNKEEINNTLGEVISKNNLTQLRTAETEKYAHVTFFMNGGIEVPNINEERILIPSPKDVKTYDLKPQMSAYEVTKEVVKSIDEERNDLIIVNFANADMVGHTGVLNAAIKAIEVVDECVGEIYNKIKQKKGNLLIIADHGNAEKMLDENNKPFTAHTTNQVPFILISFDDKFKNIKLRENASLCDIAPTLLELMDIKKPKEMTGESIILKSS